ncbi:MAG TPA: VOC family protein, partial [Vicinamibacteria bacterium]|nr:VOC family protein [Vicinamibacteria bacterium]
MEQLRFLSGVLLVSPDPARLAAFYRDVLQVPLEDEEHEGTRPHWGCTLGDVHFAIHPVEDFPDRRSGVGAVKLAFTVFDLAAFLEGVKAKGVTP